MGSDRVWLPTFPLILLILQHQRLRHLLQLWAAAVTWLCGKRLPRERAVWLQCRPSRVPAVPGLAMLGSAQPCPGQSWALQDGYGGGGSAPAPPAARAGMNWGIWGMCSRPEGCGPRGRGWRAAGTLEPCGTPGDGHGPGVTPKGRRWEQEGGEEARGAQRG